MYERYLAAQATPPTTTETHLSRVKRLECVRLGRLLRRLDGAELAPSRARVPQQHDRARAAVPALSDVGTLGFLAYRVKI